MRDGLTKNLFKGLVVSAIATIIMMVILAITMNFVDMATKSLYVWYVVITCVAIVFGASYSARKNGSKGWLVGVLLGITYYILIGIISYLSKGSLEWTKFDLYRLFFAVAIGALSGMLGINI